VSSGGGRAPPPPHAPAWCCGLPGGEAAARARAGVPPRPVRAAGTPPWAEPDHAFHPSTLPFANRRSVLDVVRRHGFAVADEWMANWERAWQVGRPPSRTTASRGCRAAANNLGMSAAACCCRCAERTAPTQCSKLCYCCAFAAAPACQCLPRPAIRALAAGKLAALRVAKRRCAVHDPRHVSPAPPCPPPAFRTL
jgi:hypothetical protein